MSEERAPRPRRRRLPSPLDRSLLRARDIPGIAEGDDILGRQMVPPDIHFEPTPMGRFGGGSSPIKTDQTVHLRDHGRVAVWHSDGYLKIADRDFVDDAPNDGQPYVRSDGRWILLSAATGAVGEAPNTGLTYTRDGSIGAWVPLPYVIPEAPLDGQGYARVGLNNTWVPVFTEVMARGLFAPIATVSFPEAPQDGQAYLRRGWDHAWVPAAAAAQAGGVMDEAPLDGNWYVRGNGVWALAFTQTEADKLYKPIDSGTY